MGLALYTNPIYAPDVGKLVEVWLTVVEPAIVGVDKAPILREEQVNVVRGPTPASSEYLSMLKVQK